jgi:hypothetical protein
MVPAGVPCAVTRVSPLDWLAHTTTQETGFERYERKRWADGECHYEFRQADWLMVVPTRLVRHR